MNLPNGGDKQVINDANKAPSSHHKYNLSYQFAATERFGEVSPFVFAYGVPDDKNFTFRIGHQLRTTALRSPLLQDLRKNLDYYVVPTRAILPHTWDFLQSNPVIGNDVISDDLNCLIYYDGEAASKAGIIDVLESALSYGGVLNSGDFIRDGSNDPIFKVADWDKFVHFLIILETFFANDSLFEAYRMPLLERMGKGKTYFSDALSQAWKFYHEMLHTLSSDITELFVTFTYSGGEANLVRSYKIKNVSERMRLYYDLIECPSVNWSTSGHSGSVLSNTLLTSAYDDVSAILTSSELNMLDRDIDNYGLGTHLSDGVNSNLTKSIDIRPILAYQLVCAEYFTNDHIDYVYSADMFRKIYESQWISASSGTVFTLNGNSYPYDGFSSVALASLFSISTEASTWQNGQWSVFALLINLFTRKRSLRYVDYFVGARSHPLAVGDVNVVVSGGQVSAVDMTKGIQTARFLLAANRVGPKSRKYLKGIFGAEGRTPVDTPIKVAHVDSSIYGVETQNTGAAQLEVAQTITTNLVTRVSDYAFQMDLEEDSMFIGVASYEIPRFYLQAWSKFASKVDRFDWFNPYFQFTGDQAINQDELSAGLDSNAVFGYQSKDLEYKLNIDYAIGDFKNSLRGWIFAMADIEDPSQISPDFIRAHQTELDRFFLSMTALASSQRYHFICTYNNKIEASRNMVFDPNILK